jgi:hypothetical protein
MRGFLWIVNDSQNFRNKVNTIIFKSNNYCRYFNIFKQIIVNLMNKIIFILFIQIRRIYASFKF